MNGQSDIFNTELGKKLLALTKASFKVSNLITDLTMRDRIKSKALSIYENFCNSCDSRELLKEIGALDNLLRLSGHLGMVEENYSQILRNGYLVFKSHVIVNTHEPPAPKAVKILSEKVRDMAEKRSDPIILRKKTEERYEKILQHIENKGGQIQLSDVVALFPKLSEKSVRNDLGQLCNQRKLKRMGWGKSSYYQLQEEEKK